MEICASMVRFNTLREDAIEKDGGYWAGEYAEPEIEMNGFFESTWDKW